MASSDRPRLDTGLGTEERVDAGEVVLLTGRDAARLRPVTLTLTA